MTVTSVVLVVYDLGSLAPTRIAQAVRENGAEPVFVAADTDHARQAADLLALLGATVRVDPDRDLLLRALDQLSPAGIVTFSDRQVAFTAQLAAQLDLPHHRLEDIPAITRKDAQRRRFAEHGLEAIRFRSVTDPGAVEEAVAHVGVPAVIKPTSGAGSRNTLAATTEAQARDLITGLLHAADGSKSEIMIEEFLVGRPTPAPWGGYLSVDVVANGNDVVPVFTSSKFALAEPFRERGGYGNRSREPIPDLEAAHRLACTAVQALGIRNGMADVDLMLTADGPRLLEVNGRLGAWVDDLATRSNTADPAGIAIRSALGRTPDVGEPVDGPVAFRYLVQPPRDAARVRAVRGADPIRRIQHVDRVSVQTRPGIAVDWRLGTRSAVAEVQGVVDDIEQLATVVARIEDTRWIDYD